MFVFSSSPSELGTICTFVRSIYLTSSWFRVWSASVQVSPNPLIGRQGQVDVCLFSMIADLICLVTIMMVLIQNPLILISRLFRMRCYLVWCLSCASLQNPSYFGWHLSLLATKAVMVSADCFNLLSGKLVLCGCLHFASLPQFFV